MHGARGRVHAGVLCPTTNPHHHRHPTTIHRPITNIGGVDRPPGNLEDATDDLPNDPVFRNSDAAAMRLRAASPAAEDGAGGSNAPAPATAAAGRDSGGGVGGLSAALMREGAAMRQHDAAAGAGSAAAAGTSGSGEAASKTVDAVVGQFAADHLLFYNGTAVKGWQSRPVVSGCLWVGVGLERVGWRGL